METIMSLVNWIDKKLEEIQSDGMFKIYFDGVEIQEIEGTY